MDTRKQIVEREDGLNCTRLECKVVIFDNPIISIERLNCTRLECKEPLIRQLCNAVSSLNCTRLECKDL